MLGAVLEHRGELAAYARDLAVGNAFEQLVHGIVVALAPRGLDLVAQAQRVGAMLVPFEECVDDVEVGAAQARLELLVCSQALPPCRFRRREIRRGTVA